MLQALRRNIWLFVTILLALSITINHFSQDSVLQQPLLTQCLDDVFQPGCYRETTTVRDCCTYMGLPGYYRQVWEVGIWRHVDAPRSKWYWRTSRISTTPERCTPMDPLTCRPIPIEEEE